MKNSRSKRGTSHGKRKKCVTKENKFCGKKKKERGYEQ